MKRFIEPKNLIYVGLFLILLGIVLPLLMIMRYITPTLFIEFLSYTVSVLGLMLGVIGMAYMVAKNRHKQ
jgi:hypothetical protein